MQWIAAVGAAAALLCLPQAQQAVVAGAPAVSPPTTVSQDETGEASVTVMSRNLYLGADIGAALELLPDLPAAGQLLWDQVVATDYDTRVELLASEILQTEPAVVGLQEAARWMCQSSLFAGQTDVLNFTPQLLRAISAGGTDYVIAEAAGRQAANPGFRIGPLPGVSMTDPATFQPIFGQDQAYCGFEISDVLLVRSDLAAGVLRAGTSEYEIRETIVPTVLAIDRGYAWADIDVGDAVIRFVTTHLESSWSEGEVPPAARQAVQLVTDLAETTGPLVVMGDFNSDPRDPRGQAASNPAEQPTASAACSAQPAPPTLESALIDCSAYWTMRRAGYISAGPDDLDPAFATYGASALLAGPDPDRLRAALADGNTSGFTDRLDYVFVRNGVRPESGQLTGAVWPYGPGAWPCLTPQQVADTAAAAAVLAEAGLDAPPAGTGVCLPSDHAGVVVSVAVDPGASVASDPPPVEHHPFRLVWWHLAVLLGALIVAVIWWRVRARRRRRAQPEASAPA